MSGTPAESSKFFKNETSALYGRSSLTLTVKETLKSQAEINKR